MDELTSESKAPRSLTTDHTPSSALTHGQLFLVPTIVRLFSPDGNRQDVYDPHAMNDERRRTMPRPVPPLQTAQTYSATLSEEDPRPCSCNTHVPSTAEANPTAPTTGLKPDHHSSIPEEHDPDDSRLDRECPRANDHPYPRTTGCHLGYQN